MVWAVDGNMEINTVLKRVLECASNGWLIDDD